MDYFPGNTGLVWLNSLTDEVTGGYLDGATVTGKVCDADLVPIREISAITFTNTTSGNYYGLLPATMLDQAAGRVPAFLRVDVNGGTDKIAAFHFPLTVQPRRDDGNS